MGVEGWPEWKKGQDTLVCESWTGVRTRFWVIAILVNLGACLEPFRFAARTEADGIDIPRFCCQREGEQDFAAPSNCAHYFQHSVTLCAELDGCNSL